MLSQSPPPPPPTVILSSTDECQPTMPSSPSSPSSPQLAQAHTNDDTNDNHGQSAKTEEKEEEEAQSAPTSTSIHDLHVDVLVAIFARLGLRDLCTVEQGELRSVFFFSFCCCLFYLLCVCKVCKKWRDVARLAWSTRPCIRMNRRNMTRTGSEDTALGIFRTYFTTPDQHVLDKLVATKHVGHALTTLDLSGYSLLFDTTQKKSVSLAALAQHCFNLEHLNLRQVKLHTHTHTHTHFSRKSI